MEKITDLYNSILPNIHEIKNMVVRKFIVKLHSLGFQVVDAYINYGYDVRLTDFDNFIVKKDGVGMVVSFQPKGFAICFNAVNFSGFDSIKNDFYKKEKNIIAEGEKHHWCYNIGIGNWGWQNHPKQGLIFIGVKENTFKENLRIHKYPVDTIQRVDVVKLMRPEKIKFVVDED